MEKGWSPHGAAMLDYHRGDTDTLLRMHYVDGDFADLPMHLFFRTFEEMPELEQLALHLCKGKILDVGAGAGEHALWLQERGEDITGMDISEDCALVMKEKGLEKVLVADILNYTGDRFDTMLMLMHGIGFVQTLDGLREFLQKANELLRPNGQILLDSSDINAVGDLESLHGENYRGETFLQLEYKGKKGEETSWLYIDQDTLADIAFDEGYQCLIVEEGEEGRYLALLQRIEDGPETK